VLANEAVPLNLNGGRRTVKTFVWGRTVDECSQSNGVSTIRRREGDLMGEGRIGETSIKTERKGARTRTRYRDTRGRKKENLHFCGGG